MRALTHPLQQELARVRRTPARGYTRDTATVCVSIVSYSTNHRDCSGLRRLIRSIMLDNSDLKLCLKWLPLKYHLNCEAPC